MRRDRTAVLHFAAQVVRSLAGFGTTLLAARYFGAAGLGVYSQVLALVFWLKLPGNSATSAVSKRMSESETLTGHFSAGLIAILGYGILVGGGIFLFEGVVDDYLNADAAYLLVALLLANMTFDIVKSGFIGSKRVALSGWLGTAEQVVRLGSQVAFVLGGAMVIGLVFGHIVSLLLFALLGTALLRDRLTVPDRSDFEDLRTFAQYSWLGDLKGLALSWMDILVLGIFVADGFVGIYQAAWTLASFLALTSKSIGTTLFPELSELGTKEMYDRAGELVGDGLLFTGVFLIPGAFGALVIGGRVLEVYRGEFAAGATILVLLIAARTLHEFGGQFVGALNGLDRPEVAFRINAVFFATNFLLNVGLVFLFGWYGAAVATLTSSGVYLVVSWFALRDVLGVVRIPASEIGLEVAASLVMAAAIWAALPYLPRNVFVTAATVFLGAGIYGTVLLVSSTRIRRKVFTLAGI